jgi:hypothetical protein
MNLRVETMPPNENPHDYMKMYVLVNRESLTLVQCGVQACHSVAEFMDVYGEKPRVKDWVQNHKTMILLEATQQDLQRMKEALAWYGYVHKSFYEPDLNNLETAVAFEPMLASQGKEIFRHLKLLS